MPAGRWLVTPHAVMRFQQRVPGARRLTYRQILGRIIRDSDRAHFVRVEGNGMELWRVGKPLRTRYRVDPGPPARVVTVLAGCERGRRDRC